MAAQTLEKLLLCADAIKIWVPPATTPAAVYNPHPSAPTCAVWSPSNQVIASGGSDGVIFLTLSTGSTLCSLHRPGFNDGTVHSLVFSGSSKYLVSGHASGCVILWDLRKKEALKDWTDSKTAVRSVAFNGDDTFVAAGNAAGEIFVWEMPVDTSVLGTAHLYFKPSDKPLCSLRFSPIKRAYLAAAGEDGGIYVYDVTANKLKAPFLGVHKSSATAVEFSQKNGMLMCSAGLDGKINLYDVEDRKLIKSITTGHELTSLSFMYDGANIAVGTSSGVVQVYDLRQSSTAVLTIPAFSQRITSIMFTSLVKKATSRPDSASKVTPTASSAAVSSAAGGKVTPMTQALSAQPTVAASKVTPLPQMSSSHELSSTKLSVTTSQGSSQARYPTSSVGSFGLTDTAPKLDLGSKPVLESMRPLPGASNLPVSSRLGDDLFTPDSRRPLAGQIRSEEPGIGSSPTLRSATTAAAPSLGYTSGGYDGKYKLDLGPIGISPKMSTIPPASLPEPPAYNAASEPTLPAKTVEIPKPAPAPQQPTVMSSSVADPLKQPANAAKTDASKPTVRSAPVVASSLTTSKATSQPSATLSGSTLASKPTSHLSTTSTSVEAKRLAESHATKPEPVKAFGVTKPLSNASSSAPIPSAGTSALYTTTTKPAQPQPAQAPAPQAAVPVAVVPPAKSTVPAAQPSPMNVYAPAPAALSVQSRPTSEATAVSTYKEPAFAPRSGDVQTQFIKNIVDDSLEAFRFSLHRDVLSMHVELLRQFQIQRNEIESLMRQYSINDELVAEINRLREENARLKRAY